MKNHQRPLENVKVVELATFIAAPCCARFLADMGAEVTKVESFEGDPLRYTAVNEGRPAGEEENTSFDLENCNKISVSLNTKSPDGREALEKLIAGSDIFITNWRQSALERAGLDYEGLKKKYPSLIMGYVSGYGETGPDKDLPGFDFTAFYARGGILGTMFDKDHVPMNTIPGFGDQQVGMYLAAGVLAALYRARETGRGEKVTVSLFHTAIWDIAIMLQSSQYGHPSTQFPLSRKHLANPLNVAHKTRDGRWIQIAMPRYDYFYDRFMEILGVPELKGDNRFFPQARLQDNLEEFYEILEGRFATRDLNEWVQALKEADIPYAVAQTWNELLQDRQAWESNCFHEMAYPTGNSRTLVRSPVMFTETPLPEYNRGPYLGEQTRAVLEELGYSREQISAMIEAGAAQSRS
ncbi:cinnamoyl-CoA:phenyllactate CoA-transferase [Alkalispirochaeta americana]|uniref:Cinnamoyl-CoA:phenyllactate CoA-transferase n=1 Tax=Alkalispirochaeta americana TaxID=159291 RepID=A0A1N6SZB8_9SPIO|nr:CaiB/BaiF CoA-transferase family protein [Alkalispirochaeta americana]SIQ46433.1 cinnamoyl-CoA:phenyllactate CoA-transferase [Alkalispirochaeta americana]